MPSRRQTVLGLGGLLGVSGALVSSGAFDTVGAERVVGLETAGDADAFLGLEIIDGDHVDETQGTIEFDLIAEATTTYEELINIRNNGTQSITSLRFEFIVEGANQDDADAEAALQIISSETVIDAEDERNLLIESDAGVADDNQLTPGEAIPIGIAVDLTDDDIDRIDGDPEIALRIIAETGEVDDSDSDPDPDPDPPEVDLSFADEPAVPPGPDPDVEFSVSSDSGAVNIDGFRIEVDRQGNADEPETFDSFDIAGKASGDAGYDIGSSISHGEILIEDNPVEYEITGFRDGDGNKFDGMDAIANPGEAGEFTVVLFSGSTEYEVG